MYPVFTSRASGMLTISVLMLSSSWAATPASQVRIQSNYQADRAACLSERSQHERSSCLREAGAVRAEAQKGRRGAAESEALLAQNARQRCKDLPGENKPICERMVLGEGSVSGSVSGGGVLRELVIPMSVSN